MARVAIDPALWNKTRRAAFDEGRTGADIVNEALLDWHAKQAASSKLSVGAPHSANPPKEGGAIVRDWEDPLDKRAMIESGIDIAKQADKTYVRETPTDPWKELITTPQEAAKAAAQIPSFRPVPKPSQTKKTRGTSKSA